MKRFVAKGIISDKPTGTLYLATEKDSERYFVIRRFGTKSDPNPLKKSVPFINSLAKILKKLPESRFIPTLGNGNDKNGPYLVMPYIDGTTLENFTFSNKVSEETLVILAKRTLEGLAAAHVNNLFHGALAKDCIFLPNRQIEPLKSLIMDVGMHSIALLEERFTGDEISLQAPFLTAPETLETGQISAASDFYSLGQLLYQLAAVKHPHEEMSRAKVIQSRQEANLPPLKELRPDISAEFSDWVAALSNEDPSLRPSFAGEALLSLGEIERSLKTSCQITGPVPGLYQVNHDFKPKTVDIESLVQPMPAPVWKRKFALLAVFAIGSVFYYLYVSGFFPFG